MLGPEADGEKRVGKGRTMVAAGVAGKRPDSFFFSEGEGEKKKKRRGGCELTHYKWDVKEWRRPRDFWPPFN